LVMIKIYLLFLVLVMSCGKSVTEDADEEVREEMTPDGTFSALLIPVNERLSSSISGDVKVLKYGDNFSVRVRLKNASGGKYSQHLHTGIFCPGKSQDTNTDGFIDGFEARKQAGQIIVPFDDDLSSQFGGSGLLLQGSYSYSKSTSYYLMLSDLHLPDEIINDSIIKLREKDLPLERRVVVIYAQGKKLPSTVSGSEIPIACGILTRTSDFPSPPNEDSYEEDARPSPRSRPRPRPPAPRPGPVARPIPEPDIYDVSWWDRIRQRWNRWRGRGRSNNNPEKITLSITRS
jgi:hypothetical protein